MNWLVGWSRCLVGDGDVPQLLIGFPCCVGEGHRCRGGGFGSGVAFVVLQTQYHSAVLLDVSGGLGGWVVGFVKMVGGGVVV